MFRDEQFVLECVGLQNNPIRTGGAFSQSIESESFIINKVDGCWVENGYCELHECHNGAKRLSSADKLGV